MKMIRYFIMCIGLNTINLIHFNNLWISMISPVVIFINIIILVKNRKKDINELENAKYLPKLDLSWMDRSQVTHIDLSWMNRDNLWKIDENSVFNSRK